MLDSVVKVKKKYHRQTLPSSSNDETEIDSDNYETESDNERYKDKSNGSFVES